MIYLLIGFIGGFIVSNMQGFSSINKNLKLLVEGQKPQPVQQPTLPSKPVPVQLRGTGRKGLMERSLSSTDRDSKRKTNIDVVYEVYEIERSKDKSKIGILEIQVNQSEYSTDSYKEMMKNLYENSWIDSKDVEWLDEAPELVRDEKLNDLLN
jgi:hypothetical protein